jgi:hypothetical protein
MHDVSLTSPTSGDFLKWNGTVWVNDPTLPTSSLSTSSSNDNSASMLVTGVTVDEYGRVTNITSATHRKASETETGIIEFDGQYFEYFDGPFSLTGTARILANLTPAVDKLPYFNSAFSAATTNLTSAARTLLDDTSTSAMRTTLGVGTTDNPAFAGATIDGVRVGITAANEIDTVSGNLTIDSAGGTVTIDDNLIVSGNITASGTVRGSGSIVQVVSNSQGSSDLTSAGYVGTVTMAPKFANSNILVLINYHVYKYNSNTAVNNYYQLRNVTAGTVIRENAYLTYGPPDYMFQGVISGIQAAGSTSSRQYGLLVDAAPDQRIYFYWSTTYAVEITV